MKSSTPSATISTPFDPKEFIAHLPLLPGVYRMLDAAGQVLYVGKAKQLKKRVASYFLKGQVSPRIRLMVSRVARIETTVTESEAEALILENNLIKSLKPRYNILFRDDKSYPYIMLTNEAYPRLAYYRGATRRQHHYFGPYPNVGAAKETINLLQKVFALRTCEDSVFRNRSRPCLLHQIQRCTAPCVQAISQEDYARDVRSAMLLLQGKEEEVEHSLRQAMEQAAASLRYEQAAALRDRIQALRAVQQRQYMESGRSSDVDVVAIVASGGEVCVALAMVRGGRHLGDRHFFPQNGEDVELPEALEAFLVQHYLEQAAPPLILTSHAIDAEPIQHLLERQSGRKVEIRHAVTGERRQWLALAEKNALLALQQKQGQHASQLARLAELQRVFGLPGLERIECFDISHTMGEATTASCVVYDQQNMRPAEYRRFNISGIAPGDDYAAMRQALLRRYGRLACGEGKRPDLVLIDGGVGQLAVASEVMAELGLSGLPLAGVAKGVERKAGLEQLWRPGQEKPLQLPPHSPALHLIQQIRDEAHRFAVSGHRGRRGKARTASRLEEIPGIGEKRRRDLLAHFGGIKGVQEAAVEELLRVKGINQALAEKIYQQFHP